MYKYIKTKDGKGNPLTLNATNIASITKEKAIEDLAPYGFDAKQSAAIYDECKAAVAEATKPKAAEAKPIDAK